MDRTILRLGAYELLAEHLVEEFTDGVDAMRELCAPFTPESIAGITGVWFAVLFVLHDAHSDAAEIAARLPQLDRAELLGRLQEREQQASTGIGNGVASLFLE